jgi:hypothetical protein
MSFRLGKIDILTAISEVLVTFKGSLPQPLPAMILLHKDNLQVKFVVRFLSEVQFQQE